MRFQRANICLFDSMTMPSINAMPVRCGQGAELLTSVNVVPLTAVAFAGVVSWVLGGWSHPIAFDESTLLLVAALAMISVARAARLSRGSHRAAWIALLVGLGFWMLGEAVWIWESAHLLYRPFPSLADVGFIMLPISACIALLLFPSADSDRSRGRHLLDGLIVSGSLFVITWILFIDRLRQFLEGDDVALLVTVVYPTVDLVALTIAAALLARMQPGQRLTITMLTFGLISMWFARGAFIYLSTETGFGGDFVTDVGWVIGLLLITLAAATDREVGRTEYQTSPGPGWVSIWLPYGLLVIAGIVAATNRPAHLQSWPVAFVAGLLVSAVLARQLLAFVENRRLLAAVAEQALRDPLTGVANRALLDYRLEQAMRRHAEGVSVGVVSLDVDDFKLLNDTLGHPAGDSLLIDIARRLLACVDEGDTVARLGGDEFMILTEGPSERSQLVAHRIVDIFSRPFVIDGNELFVSASVGLAIAGVGNRDDHTITAEQLFKRADLAMYAGKRSRTGGVHNFTPKLETDAVDKGLVRRADHNGGAATVRLLGELRHAIDHSELMLVYQPKYDLDTLTVVGAEALLRWQHPRLGMLAPNRFLPLVRRHGLIRPVTDFVVNRAVLDASRWYKSWGEVPVAINLFAPSLADTGLKDMIISALASKGLTGRALTVEITEDLVLENIGGARNVLNQLRENGIRVAIDDFGSGYAALSYLRDLPIDEVKLDRDFISPVLVDERAGAVVRAVVDLAHVLGLTTVAEGVENAQAAARLREYGCDVGQGYFFSRPVAFDDLLRLPTSAVNGPTVPTSAISS